MMDKTGTLTEGNFAVNEFESFSQDYTKEEVLSLMAALEQTSSHPLAVGVLNKMEELGLSIPKASDVTNLPGIGMEGLVEGKTSKLLVYLI